MENVTFDFRRPLKEVSSLWTSIYGLTPINVIAKLNSVKFSASQVALRLALLSLNSPPTPPPHPDKYIWATSRLPWVLKFGKEPYLTNLGQLAN